MDIFRYEGAAAVLVLCALSSACAPPPADTAAITRTDATTKTETSYRKARALLERAERAMGPAAAIADAPGLRFDARGRMDQSTEHQGRSLDEPSWAPFAESLAVDPAVGRVAYEYRHERVDGTSEWVREIYDEPDRRVIVVLDDRFAVPLHSSEHREHRLRLLRRVPQLLVRELLEAPAALRALGDDAASGTLPTGERVTVFVDEETSVVRRVDYLMDAPSFGDSLVNWRFDDYRPVAGGGLFPRRYGVSLDGRPFTEMQVERVALGLTATGDLLTVPDGIELPEPIELPAGADPARRAQVRQAAPGVFVVESLRTGFHVLFVELPSFVVAVDAPAGYPLLNELPASDVAPGPTSDWLSRRYLELIQERVPDKPVRYVVLTHFHNDHAGGLRAFVDAGATVIAAEAARETVERFVSAEHTIAPDALSRSGRALSIETVEGRRTIEEGGRRIDILEIGDNPHADDLLAVHLPGEKLLYVSDLLHAVPLDRFPAESHERVDRFFAGWLADRDLDLDDVFTAHGSGRAGPEHLERLRALADR